MWKVEGNVMYIQAKQAIFVQWYCHLVITLFTHALHAHTQGECCSSYAFGIVAALEGSHALATGQLVSLSEQNVVDCSGMNNIIFSVVISPIPIPDCCKLILIP